MPGMDLIDLPGPPDPSAARLVLLVGPALRPDAGMLVELARHGLRGLWRPSIELALRTGELATPDALVLDLALPGADGAATLSRLQEVLDGPIVAVASAPDPDLEVAVLERGADLVLSLPLPATRLRAHLVALLRRPSGSLDPDLARSVSVRPAREGGVDVLIRGLPLPASSRGRLGPVRGGAGGLPRRMLLR